MRAPEAPTPGLFITTIVFAGVGALGAFLSAIALALVGVPPSDPLVANALIVWPFAAVAAGLLTPRAPARRLIRVLRTLWIGVIIHPIAWLAFVVCARFGPNGQRLVGTLLDDLSTALMFSIASIFYGIWLTFPAAALAQWIAGVWARMPPPEDVP